MTVKILSNEDFMAELLYLFAFSSKILFNKLATESILILIAQANLQ